MSEGRLRHFDPLQVALLFGGALQFYLMHRVSEQGAFDTENIEEGISVMIAVFFDGLERT
jgi:hypothetical protein